MHVCIYHIVENSAKYISNAGNFTVMTSQLGNKFEVIFEMDSLAIHQDEIDYIFQENYSGKKAIIENLHGSGIGLYISRQLAILNGGGLSVIAGVPKPKDPDYARNRFILTIPNSQN